MGDELIQNDPPAQSRELVRDLTDKIMAEELRAREDIRRLEGRYQDSDPDALKRYTRERMRALHSTIDPMQKMREHMIGAIAQAMPPEMPPFIVTVSKP